MSEQLNTFIENSKLFQEKIDKYGDFGVTAEDHASSTAPTILIENPGKTLSELLSEQEILDRLNRDQEIFEGLKALNSKRAEQLRNRFFVNIEYLKSINKLPKDFIQTIE